MTKILLIGSNGQVGWELRRALAPLGEVTALDRTGMDLSNPDSIRHAIGEAKPGIIVNAAAYTAVDKAEAEPDLAMQINSAAPGIMAREARRLGALLVHYSTDYVFDGTGNRPYAESDPVKPVNSYGRSKLAGEESIRDSGAPHLIFRTSWVYAARGNNFVRTMLRLARERNELKIVNDQIGAPTSAKSIAEMTAQVLGSSGRMLNQQGAHNIMNSPPHGGGVSRSDRVVETPALNHPGAGPHPRPSPEWRGAARACPSPLGRGGRDEGWHHPSLIRRGAEQGAVILADALKDRSGVYHFSAAGAASWFGFAEAIFAEAKNQFADFKTPKLVPISTSEYPLPARRPANSRLDCSKLTATFGITPPRWDAALEECMNDIRETGIGKRES